MMVLTVVTVAYAGDDRTFQEIRQRMESILERRAADGSKPINKQFRRWEWFWERRQGTDGSMPSIAAYVEAARAIDIARKGDQAQAMPSWREVGPVAPAGGPSRTWFGIGRMNCIAGSYQNPDLLYAGSANGGLWRSTNGGGMWSAVNVAGLPMFGVSDIAIDHTNDKLIYVATGDANNAISGDLNGYPAFSVGVIKTTDGGTTWSTTGLSYEFAENIAVNRLWLDPRDNKVVVAATTTGIRRTDDGGATWANVLNGMNVRDMMPAPGNPNVLLATTFSFFGNASFMRSEDAGRTWSQVLAIPQAIRLRLATSKAEPDGFYAVASTGYPYVLEGVYRSVDAGKTFVKDALTRNILGRSQDGDDFNEQAQGFYDLAMTVSPEDPSLLFVGGINIWESSNRGASWSLNTEGNGYGASWVHADHHYLTYHPTIAGRLYSCHDGGLAMSTDDGITWTDISQGLKVQQYYAMDVCASAPDAMIAGAQDNATMVKRGDVERQVIGGDGMECFFNPRNVNQGFATIYYGYLYRTDDFFGSVSLKSDANSRGEAGAWVTPYTIDPNTPALIHAGYQNVWRSTNSGDDWRRLGTIPNPNRQPLRHVAVSPVDNNVIIASFTNTMYRTTNSGQTWVPIPTSQDYITELECDPTVADRYYVTFGGHNASTRVVRYDGDVMTDLTGRGLPRVPVNAVALQVDKFRRLYVGTDVGVYYTDEGSDIWRPYGQNMPAVVVTDLVITPSNNLMRVSTYGRGIWEVDVRQCTAAVPSVVASATSICAGDTITVMAPSGYAAYMWSSGDTTRVLRLSAANQSGSYAVAVVDDNGCTAVSAPVDVTITRSPTRPTISRRGVDTLRSTAIGGVTVFQWYRNGEAIEGATQRDYVATLDGTYTVVVTNGEGCSSESNPYTLILTSVDDLVAVTSWSLAPNPTTTTAWLRHAGAIGTTTIDVVDITGRLVYSTSAVDTTAVAIDCSTFTPGIYMVRIVSPTSSAVLPLVRQ